MLRKAFVSITLCAVLLLSPFVGLKVNALSADSISAPSAVLMESSTGKVLFEKNPHEQRPCASVTKVMTLLLVFEAIDSGKLSLDDEITASEHAAGMGGSDIWLEKGETMSADDMIKATVVVSANDAGCCMSATATRGDVSLISVVLGCKTGKERFADAAALLDYGFANVSVKELTLPEDMPKSIEVNGGMTDSVKLECKVSSKIVVDKGSGAKITTEIDLPDKIDAPVEKNRKIGTLTYLVNSKKVQSFDICAGDSVQKTSFGALLEYVFASLISL